MAQTFSTMIPLGGKLEHFSLYEPLTGKVFKSEETKGNKALVIMFICNHCPFVKNINKALVDVANRFIPQGVEFIAISSNDVINYPDDSPEKMKELAEKERYPFPYLYDESQEIAKSFGAVCTPDLFVYDSQEKLAYRGQFDDSRPGNGIVPTGEKLSRALGYILSGETIPDSEQIPSVGCGIKWK